MSKCPRCLAVNEFSLVHACPVGDEAQTPCGIWPMEHLGERMTVGVEGVTCVKCLTAISKRLQAEVSRMRSMLTDLAFAWDLPGYENPKGAAFSKLENAAVLLRRSGGELGLGFAQILESVIARTHSALAAREVE